MPGQLVHTAPHSLAEPPEASTAVPQIHASAPQQRVADHQMVFHRLSGKLVCQLCPMLDKSWSSACVEASCICTTQNDLMKLVCHFLGQVGLENSIRYNLV